MFDPCKFCSGTDVKVVQVVEEDLWNKAWCQCEHCGARGSTFVSNIDEPIKESALAAWNGEHAY